MSSQDFSFHFPGDDRGVLLIHGLTGTPSEMKFIGKGLAAQGMTVLAPQLAGHCGSEADLVATTWQDWMASVETALDRLSRDCSRIVVGGLSMGAILAMMLAARRPETVDGLALYSTSLWHDGWSISKAQVLLPLVLMLPGSDRFRVGESFPFGIKDERLRKLLVSRMRSGASGEAGLFHLPFAALRQLRGLTRAARQVAPTIAAPSLVVHSTIDDVSSLRNVRFLERTLKGPVDVKLLDDCYHMITVDQQKKDVLQTTADFIARRCDTNRP